MRDQVIISKTNGELAIAIPLFRYQVQDEVASLPGYKLYLTNGKPIAYALDCGEGVSIQCFNAEYIERRVEFLGDI